MTCQAVVKLTENPSYSRSYMISFADEDDRLKYVRKPEVWWYAFPEDPDFRWAKGGAWSTDPVAEPVSDDGFKIEGDRL